MNSLPSLHSFYTSLNDISIINNNLDTKRDELKDIIHSFNKDIQSKEIEKDLLEKNEQLGKLLEGTIAKLKKTSHNWVENFEELLNREKFRSDLENHFIIIIFGKVKAGKSSLGNFIAKNNTTDEKVQFFKYDEAGNEQAIKRLEEIGEDNGFATNNLECTVEIQGFKLKGLAWVDTPGLGSMAKANGDLAIKYIQSADYIIYPTSSNSPLQQDEIAQIKELFEQKKPVTICITKSDTQERQKDANGKFKRDENGKIAKFLVNKSDKARASQESYVKEEIEKILTDKSYKIGDIFSISTHTANAALSTQDSDLLDGSNMMKFYELITEVIKKKASSLKESTPFNGLLSFIDNELLANADSEGSIKALESSLNYFDEKVKEAQAQFEVVKTNTNSDIKSEIDFIVSSHVSEIDKNNSQEKFAIIDKELSKSISDIINKNIKEILQGFHSSLNSLEGMLGKTDEFKIEDEYKEIQVWYEDRSFLNVVTFGLLGRSKSSIEETVLVGDNKESMVLKYKQDRTQGYIESALENYESIANTFFIPLLNVSTNIKQDIDSLKQHINKYKVTLKE